MLDRIESLHRHGLIHRDLKPDNFVVGSEDQLETLHLIDFGLAKKYKNEEGCHITVKKRGGLIGNVRFSSYNAQTGLEQSRKDDLYSLGYILVYLLKGNLPWMETTKENQEERFNEILKIKKKTTSQMLCLGLPRLFETYFEYLDKLPFNEGPSYHYLKKIFTDELETNGMEMDYIYDWVIQEEGGSTLRLPIQFKFVSDDLVFSKRKKMDSLAIPLIHQFYTPKWQRPAKMTSSDSRNNSDFRIKVRELSNSRISIGCESSQGQFISKLILVNTPEKVAASTTKATAESDQAGLEDDGGTNFDEGMDVENKIFSLTNLTQKPRKLSDINENFRAKTITEKAKPKIFI